MSRADYVISIQSASAYEAVERILTGKIHKLLTDVGQAVVDQTRDRFYSTKLAPNGRRWPAWKKSYAKRNPPGSLLLQSTTLAESVRARVEGNRAIIATDCVYAKTHQYGSTKRNISKREFLGLSKRDKNQIDHITAEWLKGLTR